MTQNQTLHDSEKEPTWKAYPTLASARVWTTQLVEAMRFKLADLHTDLPAVKCVVLSGSLARLDASPQSDVDLIVVLEDEALANHEQADGAVSSV